MILFDFILFHYAHIEAHAWKGLRLNLAQEVREISDKASKSSGEGGDDQAGSSKLQKKGQKPLDRGKGKPIPGSRI